MLALARFMIMGFLALSVVYVCVSLYARAVHRDRLKDDWDQTSDGDQDEFVARGMAEYDQSLRRKLLWGVYIVPLSLVALIVYLTNFS